MTNAEKYQQIFLDVFSLSPADLETDYTFADHDEWDSLAHLQLIGELEDAFDIMFDSDDILNYGSYQNGQKILAKYGVEFDQ